jgi:hypothetical protein
VRSKLTERERRRIATRRERHGDDFDSRNARHAASFSQTKFNSKSGSAAAKLRWQKYREEKARKAQQPTNNNDQKEN